MAVVFTIWLAFGAAWLIGFYLLARHRWRRLAIGLVLLWAAILIWLAVNRFEQNHEHDVRQVVLSLYFNGHLVYGLCAFIGWKLGQKRRWRRVLKLYFRRLAGG
ncbi:hypothetical protein [Leisingera caerulea]|uniref:Uncharacterized protein n=1 Tax=Leisingera caerulea TaxID=506591 RepID=A0A9Q9HGZ5_LEICA|nr:hypothetical protein [Leisingera caerulea]UWQ52651.1 hypothetical protein K3721_11500 [Leisingera caerulea]UWQ82348.1 hypothetical protein K3726_11620 [Leisingera caerulea]